MNASLAIRSILAVSLLVAGIAVAANAQSWGSPAEPRDVNGFGPSTDLTFATQEWRNGTIMEARQHKAYARARALEVLPHLAEIEDADWLLSRLSPRSGLSTSQRRTLSAGFNGILRLIRMAGETVEWHQLEIARRQRMVEAGTGDALALLRAQAELTKAESAFADRYADLHEDLLEIILELVDARRLGVLREDGIIHVFETLLVDRTMPSEREGWDDGEGEGGE